MVTLEKQQFEIGLWASGYREDVDAVLVSDRHRNKTNGYEAYSWTAIMKTRDAYTMDLKHYSRHLHLQCAPLGGSFSKLLGGKLDMIRRKTILKGNFS